MNRLDLLAMLEPRNPRELQRLVAALFGLRVPRQALRPGSTPPLTYLSEAFFGGSRPAREPQPGVTVPDSRDLVLWAGRGTGKTMLGAVATLLEMLFRPGIQVCILAGSLEQSSRMYAYLRQLLDRPALRGVVAGPPTQRQVSLANGSRVTLLAGSQRSVRGVRVHRLRCDEVDELDPQLWAAAQFVTRSGWCGKWWVPGRIEALSTMHRAGGLMATLVDAGRPDDEGTRELGPRVMRWTALDAVARCTSPRPCRDCPLWDDCAGRARHACGHLPVADLLRTRARVSERRWAVEMRCDRPGTEHSVYPMFSLDRHVAEPRPEPGTVPHWLGGMDFGIRSPLVMLWARWAPSGPERGGRLHIAGEYLAEGLGLAAHLPKLAHHAAGAHLPDVADLHTLAIDPAGEARSDQTGVSNAQVLRRAGGRVLAPRARLREGIDVIRRRLEQGALTISPKCPALIAALQAYHFDPASPACDQPSKDGPDHACDALRYLCVAVEQRSGERVLSGEF